MPRFSVNPDISKAKTINTDFYTSDSVFEECKEKIFAPSWQYVGNTQMLNKKGDVVPINLLERFLDEPLLLTKDASDKINLISNVCTHRGNILVNEGCNINSLRCPYHGRKFFLDGKFQSMPEFKEVKNFPSKDDDLKNLPLFQWSSLLFTSLNPKFKAEVFFRDMIKKVEWMPLDDFKFRPELSKEFYVKANWALYCENYLEGFHIPFVHSSLNEVIDFGSYTTEIFFPYSNLQVGMARKAKDSFDFPKSSPDYGKKIAAYYFWVFPNMMFNFYPWGLSVNLVQPITVDECKVIYHSYVWDESKLDTGAGVGLDRVEMEDEEIVENVQRGVRSRFYNHGRYSVTREKGPHHFHGIAAEFLEKSKVNPDNYRDKSQKEVRGKR